MDSYFNVLARFIVEYLNTAPVRKLLGVESSLGNYSLFDEAMGIAFNLAGDLYHQNEHYVAELLERGVKVLIYVGEYDFICNWLGNERWTLDMLWSGQSGFQREPLREWLVDDKPAGKTRTYGNLTFATVYGAGHLVSVISF